MGEDIWIHYKDELTMHIPEIEQLANAMIKIANEMNKITNELTKANNTNSGKHMAGYVEKVEEE